MADTLNGESATNRIEIEPHTDTQNSVRGSFVSEIHYITFYSFDIQYRYASEYTAASETVPQAFSVVLP